MHHWMNAFDRYGVVPHQSLAFAHEAFEHNASSRTCVLANQVALSVFLPRNSVATCLMPGAGFLPMSNQGVSRGMDLRPWLHWVKKRLGVEVLYFPLLYDDVPTGRLLLSSLGGSTLQRRPSPALDWKRRGRDVWDRCVRAIGARAVRRLKRFRNSGASIGSLTGTGAVEAVSSIERLSWKAQCKQDMFSRKQFDYYEYLILRGLISTRVVRIGNRPIAYRLDARCRNTVFCLKWSFCLEAAAISPGFYLIARDLTNQYGQDDLTEIDLYGSPDQLKNAVCTHFKTRTDLVWPSCASGSVLLKERASHDAAAQFAQREWGSIRHLHLSRPSSDLSRT